MAFAAVVSVEQILQQLLHPDRQFPLEDHSKSQIQSFHGKICSLQSSLENIYPVGRRMRDEVNKLESTIRDTVYEAQDFIEAFVSSQTSVSIFLQARYLLEAFVSSQTSVSKFLQAHDLIEAFVCSETSVSIFLQNLKENTEKLDPIVERAEGIANSMKEEQQTSGPWSATTDQLSKSSRGNKSFKIVGQEEDFSKLRDEILKETPDRRVIPIMGLPGIGKTTLARSIYEDKDVVERFSIRSWVTVGQEYNPGEVFLKLLASIERKGQKSDGSDSMKVSHGSAEHLAVQLYNSLLDNKYLIVVDDVWDTIVWDRVKNYFPNKNSSRVIVTTRMETIAGKVNSEFRHAMVPLNKKKSWELLNEKVFGGGHCPPNLVTIGKSIAEHCGGLPLSITVVGGQLSQEMENVEYWKIVEEDTKAAAKSERETYLEILSRSYDHLPGRLKGCFLYMGAFPEDSEIVVSKLIKLWVAEGFLIRTKSFSFEQVASLCLNDLVDRNLIFPVKFSSNGRIRTCGMHDSIRHLAETKSEEERFFLSVKKFPNQRSHPRGEVSDALKGKDTPRRLSVHKNVLMCMEDVYKYAKKIKPARTLLYAGQYHHHPLPFCLTYDWMRVLDALSVHLIEFPDELVKLVHLRYLSLTYNGILPSSLSQLKNLLILIVRRHPKIIIIGKSILPVEIWYMKQLRHVLLTECDFPDLPKGSCLLENLQSLLNINAARCTEEFFKNMPNLRKLGIWIEAPRSINFYLDHLPHLESFKFKVLNPIPDKEIKLQQSLGFLGKLKKLSLSGCGLPWARMADIEKFPYLEVLKLRQFAFQGREWLLEVNQFPCLKWLLIESLDLEYLYADYQCCPSLESLIIKHCYELKEIDPELPTIGTLKRIELVSCSHAAVRCAENIREELKDGGKDLQLHVYSSWGEESSEMNADRGAS